MKLQLINFDQAKILKELGLPQSDGWNYQLGCEYLKEYGKGDDIYDFDAYLIDRKELVYAPTLELAAKWFREEKNLFIIISNYNTSFMTPGKEVSYMYIINTVNPVKALCDSEELYNSYEEALSAGIDKALEILKRK